MSTQATFHFAYDAQHITLNRSVNLSFCLRGEGVIVVGLPKNFLKTKVFSLSRMENHARRAACLFVLSLFWIKLFQYISTGLPRGPDLNKHIYKIGRENF